MRCSRFGLLADSSARRPRRTWPPPNVRLSAIVLSFFFVFRSLFFFLVFFHSSSFFLRIRRRGNELIGYAGRGQRSKSAGNLRANVNPPASPRLASRDDFQSHPAVSPASPRSPRMRDTSATGSGTFGAFLDSVACELTNG